MYTRRANINCTLPPRSHPQPPQIVLGPGVLGKAAIEGTSPPSPSAPRPPPVRPKDVLSNLTAPLGNLTSLRNLTGTGGNGTGGDGGVPGSSDYVFSDFDKLALVRGSGAASLMALCAYVTWCYGVRSHDSGELGTNCC